jgi:hypothetical protein
MSTPPKLDLLDIFKGDADTLLQARAKAKLVHKSGNIDASGDEVEMGLQALLAGQLPGHRSHPRQYFDDSLGVRYCQ